MKPAHLLSPPELDTDEMDRVAIRLRRIFLASSCLIVLIVAVLLLSVSSWTRNAPETARIASHTGLVALLFWAIVVTGYAFHAQTSLADKMRDVLRGRTLLDEMTGVFNYRYLDLRLAEEADRSRRYGGLTAVLYLDLDGFKRVNDRYGHQLGNVILRQVAGVMSQKVRLSDVFGRVGGDEFLAVLPQTDRREAYALGERLRLAIEGYSLDMGSPDGEVVDFIRLSVGVAAFPVNGETIENVVAAADKAVYQAKGDGGNCVRMAGEFVSGQDPDSHSEVLRNIRKGLKSEQNE
jgi:diguanylate cyclase (GGDEF)-like protein